MMRIVVVNRGEVLAVAIVVAMVVVVLEERG
jgi:hypothetical protein